MVSHRQKINAKYNSLYEFYSVIKAYLATFNQTTQILQTYTLLQPILTIIGSSAILITFFIYRERQEPKV